MTKKNKYFPYGHFSKQVIGYCPRTRQPVYEYKHAIPMKKPFFSGYARVIIIFFLLCVAMALMGCSNAPIVDSRGKSSANIDGSADRYHDDYYTCKSLVEDNTNTLFDKGKVVYNGFRWRLLWLSPKIQTRQDLINNCLEGRGYNVINK